jgi:hypothetical protein
MPKYLFIISFLLLSRFASANKIDSLKTEEDVINFIANLGANPGENRERLKKLFRPTAELIQKIKKYDANVDTSAIHNWIKFDADKNGLTDLLWLGIWEEQLTPFLILDDGNNKFKSVRIGKSDPLSDNICQYVTALSFDKQQLIVFHSNYQAESGILDIDTLTYKFGGVVEYKSKPMHKAIKSIKLEWWGRRENRPRSSLLFNNTGKGNYNSVNDKKRIEKFKGIIQPEKAQEIFELLDYLSVGQLKDEYSSWWSDGYSNKLIVKFEDGGVKHITDYGQIGTFGLRRLYSLLSELKESQTWRKVN